MPTVPPIDLGERPVYEFLKPLIKDKDTAAQAKLLLGMCAECAIKNYLGLPVYVDFRIAGIGHCLCFENGKRYQDHPLPVGRRGCCTWYDLMPFVQDLDVKSMNIRDTELAPRVIVADTKWVKKGRSFHTIIRGWGFGDELVNGLKLNPHKNGVKGGGGYYRISPDNPALRPLDDRLVIRRRRAV